MRLRIACLGAACTLVWLVAAVPSTAFAGSGSSPSLPPGTALPKLDGGSASDLVPHESLARISLPWRHVEMPADEVDPPDRAGVQPHVTSVPVAAVVGGLLMVSMGITQRLRRVRN